MKTKKKNWFERHLNWTLFITWVLAWIAFILKVAFDLKGVLAYFPFSLFAAALYSYIKNKDIHWTWFLFGLIPVGTPFLLLLGNKNKIGTLNMFKSNYTKIAENTTKYYLELTKRYGDRFDDPVTLLTATGVLDAQESVEIDTIYHIANNAVLDKELNLYNIIASNEHLKRIKNMSTIDKITSSEFEKKVFEEDILFNFIFSFEVEIFAANTQRFNRSDIALACYSADESIWKAIQRIKTKYKGDHLFEQAVTFFMESPEYELIREKIGILDSKVFIEELWDTQ